mmetsp:Transcript_31818/g.101520  ORF Transcript_31818/g.101520 Transcript_31818/m.101520 type:complete len:377 (-) Transcript_31818:558-1688(-)
MLSRRRVAPRHTLTRPLPRALEWRGGPAGDTGGGAHAGRRHVGRATGGGEREWETCGCLHGVGTRGIADPIAAGQLKGSRRVFGGDGARAWCRGVCASRGALQAGGRGGGARGGHGGEGVVVAHPAEARVRGSHVGVALGSTLHSKHADGPRSAHRRARLLVPHQLQHSHAHWWRAIGIATHGLPRRLGRQGQATSAGGSTGGVDGGGNDGQRLIVAQAVERARRGRDQIPVGGRQLQPASLGLGNDSDLLGLPVPKRAGKRRAGRVGVARVDAGPIVVPRPCAEPRHVALPRPDPRGFLVELPARHDARASLGTPVVFCFELQRVGCAELLGGERAGAALPPAEQRARVAHRRHAAGAVRVTQGENTGGCAAAAE